MNANGIETKPGTGQEVIENKPLPEKCIGIAKDVVSIPDDIDADNSAVAKLFNT